MSSKSWIGAIVVGSLVSVPLISTASTCGGFIEPAISRLIRIAQQGKWSVVPDSKFIKSGETFKRDLQKQLNASMMQPIDFEDPLHKLDYRVLGQVLVQTVNPLGQPVVSSGSAVKVGKSCVVTSAHTLYESARQQITSDNAGPFDRDIHFVRGLGKEAQAFRAQIFFQMTKPEVDYKERRGRRMFYGHSDIVLLKLVEHSDEFFKTITAVSPDRLAKDVNPHLGRLMTCMGSPYYKTAVAYGSCAGSEFRWKQENARVFKDDIHGGGVFSNLAAGPGMSGGPCYLNDTPASVFAIVQGGFGDSDPLVPSIPNLFLGDDYAGADATYLSLFHLLEQRLQIERGLAISQIAEMCK